VSKVVAADLDRIEARSLVWKSQTLSLRQVVEAAIDTLESKRRSLAAIESRLNAREARDVAEVEVETEGPNGHNAHEELMDRAAERRIRREQREAG